MRKELEAIVREAGEIALGYHGGLKKADIEFKSEADLVTRADREVEQFVAERLQQAFPQIGFVGEESAAEADFHSGEVFVLDPIDGTTNFVHGLPYFAISLAYLRNGELTAGVVYAPALGALYSAERGDGAQLNGDPIGVSATSELLQSMAITGFVNLRSRRQPDNIATFSRAAYELRSLLRLGSAALDLCYTADGKVDFFWEHGLHVWDVAAGALIVQEAGGRVTAMDGSSGFLDGRRGILAANPAIYPRALELIAYEGSDQAQDAGNDS